MTDPKGPSVLRGYIEEACALTDHPFAGIRTTAKEYEFDVIAPDVAGRVLLPA